MSQDPDYQVSLPDFQGPLDLLLSLIQDEELDITKISLAKVTDQYLRYLEVLQQVSPHELTDFLVIAARLVLIKSEILLPKPPKSLKDEHEEDVGEALAQQLLIYKQFKELAAELRALEALDERNFVRTAPPLKIDAPPETLQLSLDGLLKAARLALAILPLDPNVDDVVSRDIVTIGQQMIRIRERLMEREELLFGTLISLGYGRVGAIVTLLAVLELIKRQVVVVQQPTIFGELVIRKNPNPPRLTEADWAELTGQVELS